MASVPLHYKGARCSAEIGTVNNTNTSVGRKWNMNIYHHASLGTESTQTKGKGRNRYFAINK